jgi:hypothetical protein
LSADGNTLAEGGNADSSSQGAVWVFTRTNGAWSQQAKLTGSGAIGSSVFQGNSVTVSADGNTLAEGGYGDNGSGVSGVGSVWVFTRANGAWLQRNKLTGANGGATGQQGFSSSISADGSTLVEGGNFDNGSGGAAGAVWVFV